MNRAGLFVCTLLLCVPTLTHATTWHVPSQCLTIQAGIDSASAGDTVLVACGTYYESRITMKSGVCLRSQTGYADCVVLDGFRKYGSIIMCDSADSSTVIEGFTLKNGEDFRGGGMRCTGSTPKIKNCTFVENLAAPKKSDVRLLGDAASKGFPKGGGMYCSSASPTLTNCIFSSNRAEYYGSGGGLMADMSSSITLENCSFLHNEDGGLYLTLASSATLIGCVFQDNRGAITCGGARQHLTLINCTLANNSGAINLGRDTFLTLENTIVAFNGSAFPESPSGCIVAVSSCDIFGNAGGDWVGPISGQNGINGNFSADPMFCSQFLNDLHLDERSPCSPYGGNTEKLIGALGTGCGLPTWLRLELLHNPIHTQIIEIHLASVEDLDSSSIVLVVGSDTVAVSLANPLQYLWKGEYDLTGQGGPLVIKARARDKEGIEGTTTAQFSAASMTAGQGGTIAGPDGQVRLILESGALEKDAYVLILDCPTKESASCYRVSPKGILAGGRAVLEIRYDGTRFEDEDLNRLSIKQDGFGMLPSYVDPERKTVSAIVSEFGTFRLALRSPGHTRIVDPDFLRVKQNHPNPFTQETTLEFEIRALQHVDVSVFDITGRRITRLLAVTSYPGARNVIWDGTSEHGNPVAPGVYFCRVQTQHETITRKMLLVR